MIQTTRWCNVALKGGGNMNRASKQIQTIHVQTKYSK